MPIHGIRPSKWMARTAARGARQAGQAGSRCKVPRNTEKGNEKVAQGRGAHKCFLGKLLSGSGSATRGLSGAGSAHTDFLTTVEGMKALAAFEARLGSTDICI